jgi:cytochrome c biogenesis protein CcdA
LVYCSRCGTQNPDTNTVCSNCGAPLYTVGQRYPGSDREHYRRMENECFGLPNGGLIVGIIIGLIIIFVGLGLFLQVTYGISIDFWQYIWPFIIIVFGILILLGALNRQRRYSQRHSNPT